MRCGVEPRASRVRRRSLRCRATARRSRRLPPAPWRLPDIAVILDDLERRASNHAANHRPWAVGWPWMGTGDGRNRVAGTEARPKCPFSSGRPTLGGAGAMMAGYVRKADRRASRRSRVGFSTHYGLHGRAAEPVLLGFSHDGDGDDLSEIACMAHSAGYDSFNRAWTRRKGQLRRQTMRLLRKHQATVRCVASALLERGYLASEEIDALMPVSPKH
jgi:hypothetical protein